MAGIGRDILVRLRLSDKEFVDGLTRAGVKTREFSQSNQSFLAGLQSSWFGITAAISGTTYALARAIGPAMEWESAQARLAIVAGGNIQKLSAMQAIVDANSGGMFKRADVASAVAYAEAIGLQYSQTARLIPSVKGLAALNNSDLLPALEQVVIAVQTGNAVGLKRLGIILNQNELDEDAIRLHGKKIAELDMERAAEIRLSSAIEQMERFKSGEAEASKTAAGATRGLRTAVDELMVSVGESALGPLIEFVDLLAKGADEANRFSKNMRAMEENKGGGFLGALDQQVALQMGGGAPSVLYWLKKVIEGEPLPEMGPPENMNFNLPAIIINGEPWVDAGATAYDSWRDAFLKKAAEDRQVQEFMSRYLREQVGGALDETFGVTGGPMGPPAPTPAVSAVQFRLTELDSETTAMRNALQNQAEIEAMFLADRAEAWTNYGGLIQGSYGSAIDNMSFMLSAFLNREVNTQKKLSAAWRFAGKSFSSSMIGAVGEVAKQLAMMELASAMAAAGWITFGPASVATHLKAAALYGALAGVAGGISMAIGAGAQRELATLGMEREPAAGDITRSGGGSSISGRSDISAMIAKAPEVVNINVTNILERPIFFGTDPGAMQDFLDQFVGDYVRDGLRSQELAAA